MLTVVASRLRKVLGNDVMKVEVEDSDAAGSC